MKFVVEDGMLFLETDLALYEDLLNEVTTDEQPLNEANYREIMARIDNNFLKQKIRAAELSEVRFAGIENESMIFWMNSSKFEDNSLTYSNVYKIKEWNMYIDETTMNPIQRARQLMYKGNLQLHCTCPSFLFHGYKWLLNQIDASLEPETRPPVKRNPHQRGIVCKHLHRTIKTFPFYTAKLASYIKMEHKLAPGKQKTQDMKSRLAAMVRQKPDEREATYESVI